MSIQVEKLTKLYGKQKALDAISFEAKPGDVLGFLGPNGAGKSTTMKILTCYLPQTSGKASVCGFDVTTHPLEVRKQIGYLPELNPLYADMYVREYLQFSAGAYQLKQSQKLVGNIMERVGLMPEKHKKIGQLSKGYKQRVGLAQALLHDPKVLILDEPTSGLDPNQVSEIRNLISEIAQHKTVLLSTHIMQEVEAMCNRVVIINKGKIVADNPLGQLQQRQRNEMLVVVEFKNAVKEGVLKQIPGVVRIKQKGSTYEISCQLDIREEVSRLAAKEGWILLSMKLEEDSLEHIFKTLTQ
ncbi:MAG: gliding motility-associated ABC transporter ATP-binding subunit GldA [Bacteroidia bacterium]|jgi:ABC-2 type transport system ATP-binding protein|nr:gliding motility-associated ABC transporter ATP-binding subunit GldA [Bacteroidia bacterium]